jgi:hypothetical protein
MGAGKEGQTSFNSRVTGNTASNASVAEMAFPPEGRWECGTNNVIIPSSWCIRAELTLICSDGGRGNG